MNDISLRAHKASSDGMSQRAARSIIYQSASTLLDIKPRLKTKRRENVQSPHQQSESSNENNKY